MQRACYSFFFLKVAAQIGAHVLAQQQAKGKAKAVNAKPKGKVAAKPKQIKADKVTKEKAVRGGGGGGKGSKAAKVDKDGNPKVKRAPTNFMVYSTLMRPVHVAEHPEWTMTQISTKTGLDWKALDEAAQAKYTEYSKAQAEVISRGGVSVKWVESDKAAALPVQELLDAWRINLSEMTSNRDRLGEWSRKTLRASLACFYGQELVDKHKKDLNVLFEELLGKSETAAAAEEE
jgi:hypothetical protein